MGVLSSFALLVSALCSFPASGALLSPPSHSVASENNAHSLSSFFFLQACFQYELRASVLLPFFLLVSNGILHPCISTKPPTFSRQRRHTPCDRCLEWTRQPASIGQLQGNLICSCYSSRSPRGLNTAFAHPVATQTS